MAELIEAKIRRVGTSLGVLIPMDVATRERIAEGENIEIAIIKRNSKLLSEAFGSAKNARFKFKRDMADRI